MARRKTAEERSWLRERYPTTPNAELADRFEERFGWRLEPSQLACWAHDSGIRKQTGAIRWREHPEYDDFLREAIPGRSEGEIIEAFREAFGITLTAAQVSNRKGALGVLSGTFGGRFEKGHESWNRGRTWDELGFSEDARRRMGSGQFKRGSIPHNAAGIPVGSERETKDGYIEVKVRERSPVPGTNKCWKLKQRVVWEREHGEELPHGWVVLFADGDRRNFDPGNLVAIPQGINQVIQTQGLSYCDRATLETAIAIAKVKKGICAAEKRPRRCATCGKAFEPRYARQKRCDGCIARRRKER